MKKAFLCQIPIRLPFLCHYEAKDSRELQVDHPVRFPLLLLLEAYAKPEDEVRLVLTYNSEEDREVIEALREDVRELQRTVGFRCNVDSPEDFRLVEQAFEQHLTYQKKLFVRLLDEFDDVDEIYADISFGNKPTPIIVTRLLDYFQRTRPLRVGHIIYANVFLHEAEEGETATGYVYDVTGLIRLSNIIQLVAASGTDTPDDMLRQLIEM